MNKQKDDTENVLDSLLNDLCSAFTSEGRPGSEEACLELKSARTRTFRSKPRLADPSYLIKRACSQKHALPLADLVYSCSPRLSWASWGKGKLDNAVSSNLYTTELVGPDGHFESDRVRIGLLVSDSDTDYPISSHSGEETYLVISGVAEWTVDGSQYEPQNPGSLVHHPAWVPHGRRTGKEVFLGAWRWSGDLNLNSFRVK